MEKVVVGKKNKLDICLCYLKSEIDQTMLKSIKERLNEIKNDDSIMAELFDSADVKDDGFSLN